MAAQNLLLLLVSSVLIAGESVSSYARAVKNGEQLTDSLRKDEGVLNSALDKTLQDKWTLWVDSSSKKRHGLTKETYLSQLKQATTFSKVAEFLSLWREVEDLGEGAYTSVKLFKEGILPLWEDPANARGGCWTITGSSPSTCHRLWLLLVVSIFSQHFGHEQDFCGVVMNIEGNQGKLTLWNRDSNNRFQVEDVKRKLRKLLQVQRAEYKPHSLRLHYNATTRKTFPNKTRPRFFAPPPCPAAESSARDQPPAEEAPPCAGGVHLTVDAAVGPAPTECCQALPECATAVLPQDRVVECAGTPACTGVEDAPLSTNNQPSEPALVLPLAAPVPEAPTQNEAAEVSATQPQDRAPEPEVVQAPQHDEEEAEVEPEAESEGSSSETEGKESPRERKVSRKARRNSRKQKKAALLAQPEPKEEPSTPQVPQELPSVLSFLSVRPLLVSSLVSVSAAMVATTLLSFLV